MFLISEQRGGNGVGYGLDSFISRFDEICLERQHPGRAQSFAFIFYDFADGDFRKIMKKKSAFTQLDRLVSTKMSVFCLHAKASPESVEKFNRHFLKVLGVDDTAKLPCVVFFQVAGEQVTGIKAVPLDSPDLINGFHELYSVIEKYLAVPPPKPRASVAGKIKAMGGVVALEFFRALIKHVVEVVSRG